MSAGICADPLGLKVAPERGTLNVPAGAVMEFDYGGKSTPESTHASAYLLDLTDIKDDGGGNKILDPARPHPKERRLRVRDSKEKMEVLANLPAGEYVLDFFVHIPEGDVSYFFRVRGGRYSENASQPFRCSGKRTPATPLPCSRL